VADRVVTGTTRCKNVQHQSVWCCTILLRPQHIWWGSHRLGLQALQGPLSFAEASAWCAMLSANTAWNHRQSPQQSRRPITATRH
jgi:hypothetical protein